MASFRLPDSPGVPSEVRCKHCGERISLADAALSEPAPAGPLHTKRRVTAANQAVRIRVPTAVRELGFKPRAQDPVDEDGATRSEPIPEVLASLAAPGHGSPAASASTGAAPAPGAPAASPASLRPQAPAPSPTEAPHAPVPTGRERPVPAHVASELPTASLEQPGLALQHARGLPQSASPPESEQPTRAYPIPAGLDLPGAGSSEAPTVMRPTPAGLTRAAARYRRTSPAVAVQRPGARPPARPGPRHPAPPPEPWVPSPALWAFVGALLGAAIIALLFAVFR